MKKILCYLGLLAFFIFLFDSSCITTLHNQSSKPQLISYVPQTIHYPKADIPFPISNFNYLLPPAPALKTINSPRKNINENFSSEERKNIKVEDPLLMSDNNSLIINLSAIQPNDYAFPLPGAKVISPYGGRRKHHSGVDLKTCPKDTIVAAFDGIVRIAKPYYGYGNLIVIRHYNGLETYYSHNYKNFVKPDQKVKAGEPIALTGRTGRATTEHLHFEVRINGQHFNPNMVFDLEKRTLQHWCLICSKESNHFTIKNINLLPHQLMGSYSPNKQTPNNQKL